jgi:phage/conjugal plasmid C-4 type zinc finger TraR family protein
MFSDERAIETAELTQQVLSERAVARIREQLASDGEDECVRCGRAIPPARRAAMPSAERCIECQSAFERSVR